MRIALLAAGALLSASALAGAQTPARETPRPQDVDPAVNTSAPSQTPARETPRPQDVDPAVNTSAVPTNGAGDATSSTNAGAAKTTAPARPAASGAVPANAVTPNPSATGTRSTGPAAAGASAAGASSQSRSTPAASAASSTATPNAPTANAKPKSRGQDRLELDTTQITGNRELPKVLYIVPWKRADLGDLVGKPVNSLLDEVLTPVDRDVFKRENRYYRALTPVDGQPASGAPVSGAAPAGATSSGSATPPARDER